jgi:hypothetical protein
MSVYNGTKSRSTLENVRLGVTTSINGVVSVVELTTETLQVGRRIISNNLKAIEASGIRDNVVENSQEVDESLDVVDTELDALEAKLTNKDLTVRQKARLNLRIRMWEATALTIEATSKL